ncbi:MAG: LysM peptidoglycan-binding domain-containing protein [Gammaproteobacteria bacterium]
MRWIWLIAVAVGAAGIVGAQTADLPRPAELEPDIQFWVRVYTEIDTSSGFLHDSVHLGAVYRIVRFPDGISRRARTRQLNQAYQGVRDVLAVLADGKRADLSAEEQRMLALWPEDVSNADLRASSRRLRFQLGQSDRFRAGLIRSGTWRTYIEGVLAERGLPPELIALPHVESSFDPTAYSKAGAAGLWQFTRSTGLRYMRIDHIVDERRDPFISTIAATRLLENNYDVLGNWPLAITAYNHGQAGMRRAVRQLGTDAIETILREYEGRTFGFASRNFYTAFLAAVQVDAKYDKYFGPLDIEPAVDTKLVEVPDYLTVATLQSALDTNRGLLRSWNPALTEAVWSGDKFVPRGFDLRLPVAMMPDAVGYLAAIPATQRYTAQMPDIIHRVRSGDTVSQIATRYRVSVASLVQLNGLRSRNFIRAGQVLRLPGSEGTLPMTLAKFNGEEPGETYVVRAGDSIDRISRRFGVSERLLLTRNRIADKNLIYIGQELRLGSPTEPSDESVVEVMLARVEPPAPAELPPAAMLSTVSTAAAIEQAAGPVALVPDVPMPLVSGPVDFRPAERVPEPPVFIREPAETPVEEAAPLLVADSLEAEPEFAPDVNVLASVQAEMAADPSDYLVSADGTIEVQALETLGHYADWLEIRTQRLRDINGMPFRQAVVIGQRLRINFSLVDRATFEQRRMEYQRRTQEAFFLAYQITDTREHVVQTGESLYLLALRTYQVPVWLLRQFNPDLDLDRVSPGTVVKFPELRAIAAVENETRASNAAAAETRDAI